MLQFPDEVSAVAAFLQHFDDPRFFGGVQAMPVAEFRRKVLAADGEMVKSTRLEPRLRRDGVRQRYVVQVDSGHQAAGGGASPAEFVHSPGGGIDFGEITTGMARAMKRQPGKIRLPRGVQNADGTGYGLAHIEANHGKHIRGAGFASVEQFVSHVAKDFCQVWQATGRQLLVAVRDGKQHMMYVQLEPADDGDYYRVNTAFPVRQGDYPEKHGFKPLWDGSEPASTASGKRPAFASGANDSGGSDPNARGNGSTTTIPNPDEESTHKSLPSGGAFTQEHHMEKIDLLKSHIESYTRKDGTVVKAHDDKRKAASSDAINESARATNATQEASGSFRAGRETPPTRSHEYAASRHVGAANLHEKAAKMFQEAIANGENTKDNQYMAAFHAKQHEMHSSHARTHDVLHVSHPYKPASA